MEEAARTVCVDTSACIALSAIGCSPLLPLLFDRVLLPESVYAELEAGRRLDSAWQIVGLHAVEMVRTSEIKRGNYGLGLSLADEDVLTVARSRGAAAVLDDLAARKAAKRYGIVFTGTLGLLVLAKHRGLIETVRPLVEQLVEERPGADRFRASEKLIRRILSDAGEV